MKVVVTTVMTVTDRACAEEGCDRPAAVRLHIPWDENREVCTAHARVLAQQDGIVAEPLEDVEEWR
jgi:hypothetical protein